jgi:hypothetical protein
MAEDFRKKEKRRKRKSTSMLTRTPGVSAKEAVKRQAISEGRAQAIKGKFREEGQYKGKYYKPGGIIGDIKEAIKSVFMELPEKKAERVKKQYAEAMGITTKGMGKIRRKDIKTDYNKGGMVKSYATGGSVSRGQYPAQARKVKFKGVF